MPINFNCLIMHDNNNNNKNAGRPGMFSPKDRAKWDAWKAVEGTYIFYV